MASQRDHWSSRAGFVLAAAGSAIGLGNMWKFPYITWSNGGGAFVLIYLGCIAVVGLPIMISEIMIGRSTQKSAVGAFKAAAGPAWGWLGFLGVTTGFVILSYYSVIAGWSLRNFVSCMNWSINGFTSETDVAGEFGQFLGNWQLQMLVTALFMLATSFVVLRGIRGGIEKASRILLPILLGILVLLLVSALTMDGARQALGFIFAPNFSQLGWVGALEALGHSFFTLSLGMGAMVTFGSYLGRHESVVRSSITVVILDTLIALVATVVMFSVIFSVAGMSDSLGKSPVGMLFITLPNLFYDVVPFGRLLAPLFYVLVGFAALTSTISLLEVVVSYFIDQHGVSRRKATLFSAVTITGLGLMCSVSLGAVPGLSSFEIFEGKGGLLSTLDHLASNWFLPIGGFFTTLAAGWFISRNASHKELVDDNTPGWFNYDVWRTTIRFIAPAAVAMIILAVIFFGKDFS